MQFGKAELKDIVKIGQAGESAKVLVGGWSGASGKLLSDYGKDAPNCSST